MDEIITLTQQEKPLEVGARLFPFSHSGVFDASAEASYSPTFATTTYSDHIPGQAEKIVSTSIPAQSGFNHISYPENGGTHAGPPTMPNAWNVSSDAANSVPQVDQPHHYQI